MDNFYDIYEKMCNIEEQEETSKLLTFDEWMKMKATSGAEIYGRVAEEGYVYYLEQFLGRVPSTEEVKKYGKIARLTSEPLPKVPSKSELEEQEISPEDVLMDKIDEEIKGLHHALRGDYWFHEDIGISEILVLNWIKENRPEFYEAALIDPEEVDGSDIITDALSALGYMKEWHEVEEEELSDPEDIQYWKIAQGL